MTVPLPNGSNGGRDRRGRFAKGNSGGPGNPMAAKVGQLRASLLRAVSVADLRAVVKSLVMAAKEGDVHAAKVLLDRLLGPPMPADFEVRLAELEDRLSGGK